LAEEVALKKQPMNANVRFAAAELKKIVSNLTAQTDEIRDLVSPSAPVHGKDLKQAEAALGEILFSE
jgi:hypothetical protein